MHPKDVERLHRIVGAEVDLKAVFGGGAQALPSTFGCMLAAAVALARNPDEAERLRQHYLVWMPTLRRAQLDPSREPQATFFHTPLQAARLPRLLGALDEAAQLLQRHGLDPQVYLGFSHGHEAINGRTLAELYERCHFGGLMPLLYGYPGDLQSYAQELARDDVFAVLDRRLCAPLIHDMMHGPRERAALFPAYFDECMAGYWGVQVLPSFAFPPPGEDNAIWGAPWFSQVGLGLVYGFGEAATIRAHMGVLGWEEVLGGGLVGAFERLGWGRYLAERGAHFLDGNTEPMPWIKLIFLALAGEDLGALTLDDLRAWAWERIPSAQREPSQDQRVVEHALKSLYLKSDLAGGSPRVTGGVEGIGEVVLDPWAGVARRELLTDRVDLAAPHHWLPPSLCARLRAQGFRAVHLRLEHLQALGDLAEAITAGVLRDGVGYQLRVEG